MKNAFIISLAVLLVGCAARGAGRAPATYLVATGDVDNPTAAVDPESRTIYWSWFGPAGPDETGVYLARMGAEDAAPSEPVRVDDGLRPVNRHAQAPAQVAVGSNGHVYVAWSTRVDVPGRRFPASNVVVARSVDGGRSFEEAVFVNDDHEGEPAGHTFHNVAGGPDGTVFVSWLDSRSDGDATGEHDARHHDASGHEASGTDVRVARSTDGGRSFEPSFVVARGTCQCCRTAITVDARGIVHLAWRHIFDQNTRDIAYAKSVDGGRSFTQPLRVHDDGWRIDGCPHNGPSLAVTKSGDVHVSWYTGVEDDPGVSHASMPAGATAFGGAAFVLEDVPGARSALAADRVGWRLAWEDPRRDRIYVRSRAGREPRSVEGSAPALAAASGTFVLVYETADGVETLVEREGED